MLSINRMIVVLCLGLFVACAVAGSCYITWQTEFVRDTSYIQLSDAERDRSSFVAFIQMMVYYFLLLYQVIPISLNVSMTSVKFLQSRFMSWDLEMYLAETDTPDIVQMMEKRRAEPNFLYIQRQDANANMQHHGDLQVFHQWYFVWFRYDGNWTRCIDSCWKADSIGA